MRTSVLALAAAGALAVSSSAMAQFNESFETLTSNVGGPPGTAVSLSSGTWYVLNNSIPLGATGVSRLPTAAGGTSPFTVNPGDGSFYASMNFNNTGSLGDIDTYLMTPVITLGNGDTFSFITRGPTSQIFPDRLRVVMSQSASATPVAGDFSTILLSINESLAPAYPNTWTSFTATVSGLSGPTQGRLAFNYNVPGGGAAGDNSNLVAVDRASFAKIPEPGSFALLAGGLPMIFRRRRA